jgi:hypothetical protein
MLFIEIKLPFHFKKNLSQIKFKFPATERWEVVYFSGINWRKRGLSGVKIQLSEGQKSSRNRSGILALILKKDSEGIFHILK